jgi:hypothetical protein
MEPSLTEDGFLGVLGRDTLPYHYPNLLKVKESRRQFVDAGDAEVREVKKEGVYVG